MGQKIQLANQSGSDILKACFHNKIKKNKHDSTNVPIQRPIPHITVAFEVKVLIMLFIFFLYVQKQISIIS